jgi:hypothetical protein
MQSKFIALENITKLVRDGMALTGQPKECLDAEMTHFIKILKRHRKESEYAETEVINLGLSVRYAHLDHLGDGALVYQTRVDGQHHTTPIIMQWEDVSFFPRHIVEQL